MIHCKSFNLGHLLKFVALGSRQAYFSSRPCTIRLPGHLRRCTGSFLPSFFVRRLTMIPRMQTGFSLFATETCPLVLVFPHSIGSTLVSFFRLSLAFHSSINMQGLVTILQTIASCLTISAQNGHLRRSRRPAPYSFVNRSLHQQTLGIGQLLKPSKPSSAAVCTRPP